MTIFRSKWILALLVILVGWLGLAFIKIKLHEDIVNNELENLEVKISNLEKSNRELKKLIAFMAVPSFLEKQARILLNYKAPDEEVAFIYPDNGEKTVSASADFKDKLESSPNYVKWAYWLMKSKE